MTYLKQLFQYWFAAVTIMYPQILNLWPEYEKIRYEQHAIQKYRKTIITSNKNTIYALTYGTEKQIVSYTFMQHTTAHPTV